MLISIICSTGQGSSRFWFRAGISFANYNNLPENFDPDSRTGFMIGGYVDLDIPLSPFSIQPEILYTQKGYKTGGATLKSDYLEEGFAELLRSNAECAVGQIYIASGHPSDGKISRPMDIS